MEMLKTILYYQSMKPKFKDTKSKKPCMGCPFKRHNIACASDDRPSHPGNSHPFVYIGQARGPFWLPCHQDKNYEGVGSNTETVGACRGAAIFRSNCQDQYVMPEELLSLPADREEVFADEAEFLHHYLKEEVPISLDIWKRALNKTELDRMMHHEMNKPSDTRRVYDK